MNLKKDIIPYPAFIFKCKGAINLFSLTLTFNLNLSLESFQGLLRL